MSPGGKRPGAGRPAGPPTKVLSVRVPAADYERLRLAVMKLVTRMLRRRKERDDECMR